MPQSDELLRKLRSTPGDLPGFAPNLADVTHRSRRRRVVRRTLALVAASAIASGLAAPLWALRGLGDGGTGPGGGIVRVVPVPDHGFLRSTPYDGTPLIDHTLPEDNFLVAPKVPIASGVVRRVAWTLSAFQTTAPEMAGDPPVDPPVACAELISEYTRHDEPVGGSGEVCATGGSASSPDLSRALYIGGPGYGYALPDRLPELVNLVGATRLDVARVKIRMVDGRVDTPELVSAPPDIRWRFFVSFPPPFIDGTIIAYDADGHVIDRQALLGCSPELNQQEPEGPIFVNADVAKTGCPPLPT
jgi:hypothetical protein